ncbi:pleckstrin homology domain-containing family H member 3 isoform X2 [Hemicordylus capensis]|uniref:pleckstrin homology domain-containing family H member 3 isoform X2 n=1 Tax=Hemicordylus capensis TaxID=884348 RepID=UPI0023047683|nr:pleckstrin homology domain-containing family H member 3 isoform X2 [Hemicordylus capensis]
MAKQARGRRTKRKPRSPSSCAVKATRRSLPAAEEMCSLIAEKKCGRVQDEPDAIIKGWLQREVRGGVKTPWLRPRKYWFVLTQDSLDYYSGCDVSARRLGSLVLTSLCSVLWPDKQTYKETGYWAVTVFGRKHCYRLYTEHLNEAVHWVCALQKVIVSKAPVQTPTQLLMYDIEENRNSPEILEHIYHNNSILCYTAGPIYAPLLPFPYGVGENTAPCGRGYAALRDEAIKLFHSLQQLEGVREPALLMQGVLQTCRDLPPLVDEIYCQLVKQTTEPPTPGAPTDLRYWQLLTCMSCTFLPSPPVLSYLHLHLQRTENHFPGSEMAQYGHFITEALRKTKGRECVPSLDEIEGLMGRQEMMCTVHCPGTAACHVAISSHTTAQEVAQELRSRLGLVCSPNSFALYEESWQQECPLPEDVLVVDVLARFENLAGEEPHRKPPGRLWFRHYGCLDKDSVPRNSQEFVLLFEQAHKLVLRGCVPASEETLHSLAALRLQSLNGDFSTHMPFPCLDQLFPPGLLHSRLSPLPSPPSNPKVFPATRGFLAGAFSAGLWGGPSLAKQQVEWKQHLRDRLREEAVSVMGAIMDRWKQLEGMGQLEAMAAYIDLVGEWSAFGSAPFDVEAHLAREVVQLLQAYVTSSKPQLETPSTPVAALQQQGLHPPTRLPEMGPFLN